MYLIRWRYARRFWRIFFGISAGMLGQCPGTVFVLKFRHGIPESLGHMVPAALRIVPAFDGDGIVKPRPKLPVELLPPIGRRQLGLPAGLPARAAGGGAAPGAGTAAGDKPARSRAADGHSPQPPGPCPDPERGPDPQRVCEGFVGLGNWSDGVRCQGFGGFSQVANGHGQRSGHRRGHRDHGI